MIRQLGHYPVQSELRMKSRESRDFPNEKTIRRLGRKSDAAARLVVWCDRVGGWEDIKAICEPVAFSAPPPTSETTNGVSSAIGYVYLMKSGRYYKIGRSVAPGRREYDLGIKLPEPVKMVHKIKTDDPSGIEKYWHQRFSERRLNGEWFDLRNEDVSAFRRRKFM